MAGGAILVLGLFLSGCQLTSPTPPEPVAVSENTPMEVDQSELTEEGMMENVATETNNDFNAEAADRQYVDYSAAVYESLLGKKPLALFFHAGWCPTCRAMEADIQKNLDQFPVGTVILKADYDTEKALEKTYGVTSQSTIVVIGSDGTMSNLLLAPTNAQLIKAISATL